MFGLSCISKMEDVCDGTFGKWCHRGGRKLICALVLVGSSALASWAGERVLIQEWEGRHRDEVIADLGQPSKIKRSKGREVFIYKDLLPCTFNVSAVTSKVAVVAGDPQAPPVSTVTVHSPQIEWSKTKVVFHVGPNGRVEKALMSVPTKARDCRELEQLLDGHGKEAKTKWVHVPWPETKAVSPNP